MMSFPSNEQRLDLRQMPNDFAILHQKWRDLFFIHWHCDPSEIQKTLPQGLYVDTFEGKALLGIVPFKMRDVRPAFVAPIPGIANFLELNVRTYVYNEEGIPGVWFYSLDTNQKLALFFAKKFFHLPYFFSKMKVSQKGQRIDYSSQRKGSDESAYFELFHNNHYQHALPNSLDFFLMERYLLYSYANHHIYSTRIFHHPYLVTPAKILEMKHHLFELNHLKLNVTEPISVAFSPGVDVKIYPARKMIKKRK